MLKAIIIEDERLARENLIKCFSECETPVKVIKQLANIKESIEYLSAPPDADIIFCDVQLSDGLSFQIFTQVTVSMPVIFVTAFDNYILNAFECNGIDYLLKPTDSADVEKALKKYLMLEKHFKSNAAIESLISMMNSKKRNRLVVKKGVENISLLLSDIVLFYTEHKIVYVIDKNGKKYLLDKNLGELENELDELSFFRANRQYIININYVKGFRTYEKVKLSVDMTVPDLDHCIIISQETAPAFRRWMYEA